MDTFFYANIPPVPSENKAESLSPSFTHLYSFEPHVPSSNPEPCPVLGTRDRSVTPVLKNYLGLRCYYLGILDPTISRGLLLTL